MIRIGASSMFLHEYQPQDIFAAMNAAGLDHIEFWMETPEFWMQGADVRVLEDLLSRYQKFFPLAMHAPIFDLNPCSFNPGVAQLSAEYTCRAIEMLERLGGGVLTVHPGKRTAKRPVGPLDRSRLAAYLERIGNAAFSTSVTVAIENMPPAVNAQLVSADEVRAVLDEYAWLSFTWDYAHAKAAGYPFGFPRVCGDRMVNIHASSGVRMHAPLAASPEGEAFTEVLHEIRYDGLVTFELEDLNFAKVLTLAEKTDVLRREQEWFSGLRCI